MRCLMRAILVSMFVIASAAGVWANSYEFAFDQNMIQPTSDQYGDLLEIEGCDLTGIPGEPFIPSKSGHIVLPFGTKADNIRIISESWIELPGEYNIKPAPTQVPISYKGPLPEIVRNNAIYSSDNPYPPSPMFFSGGGQMRGYSLAGYIIYPLRYYPVSGRLELLQKLEIEVDYSAVFTPFSPSIEIGTVVSKMVDNPADVRFQPVVLSPIDPNDVKYLIIAEDDLVASYRPLADWHTQSGFPAEIITMSDIISNYEGATTQLKIKTCIYDYAVNKGTMFVLLGGDDTVVPDQNCLADGGSNTDNTMPTDLFYACFDNRFDWNSDGDTQVGEYSDGIDLYPEVFISRAPIRASYQADNFVNKTINYIKNPPDNSFVDPMLLCGVLLWNSGDAEAKCENLWNNYVAPVWPLHARKRFYDTNTDFGGPSYQVSAANMIDVLSDGYSFFFMATHGWQTGWSTETGNGFNSGHALSLTNSDEQGIVYSISCIVNAFDCDGSYHNDPCLSEGFIRNGNGGAVGFQACSRYGWGFPGPPYQQHGASFQYADAFFHYLFTGESIGIPEGYPYWMGAVAAAHKASKVPECGDGIMRWLNYGINSIGDPALDIFTENPLTMNPMFADSTYIGGSDFMVSGLPYNAMVCLWKGDEVYSVGTASSGTVSLPILPQSLGGIILTASAHNYKPYIDTIVVIAPQEPIVFYDTCFINDADGNNNNLIDFGENILLGMQLINPGLDPAYSVAASLSSVDTFIAITDAAETFGTISGNSGTLNIDDAYAFEVSNFTPDGHIVPFELEITGNARDTWTSFFNLTTHAPNVELTLVDINDASGNNNGMLDAGETVEVIVAIINKGSAEAYNVTGVLSEDDEYVSLANNSSAFGDLSPSGGSSNNTDEPFIVTASSDFPTGYSVAFNLVIEAESGYTTSLGFTLQSLESFEVDGAGWQGDDIWEWGSPTSGPDYAYHGDNVWATVLDGDYPNNTDCALYTPYYSISDSLAFLSFYQWYETQQADGGNISISSDGGWTWEIAEPEGGYAAANITGLDGEPGFSGIITNWRYCHIDLSGYIGETIIAKFRFGSDNFGNRAGWYIDGVVIHGYGWSADVLPDIGYNPSSFNVSLEQGEISTIPILLSNSGEGILEFDVSIESDGLLLSSSPDNAIPLTMRHDRTTPISKKNSNSPSDDNLLLDFGGPDDFGYSWKDSREPNGPVFNWVDISDVGVEITDIDDDINVGPFDIGFEFPFYGNTFETFRFCTNGFISFTSAAANSFNRSLPTNGIEPLNLVAPFWDNLNFNERGQAYYYSSDNSLVISYIDVPLANDPSASLTFQIILYDNGSILFQYDEIVGAANGGTVGIQNNDASIATLVAFNETYIEPDLAVKISLPISWLTVSPMKGIVLPDETMAIDVTFDASGLDIGQHLSDILLAVNDTDNPEIVIPCILGVGESYLPPSPELIFPCDSDTLLDDPIYLIWHEINHVDSFKIDLCQDTLFIDAISFAVDGNETSIDITDYINDNDWYWRAKAGNGVGWGDWSEVWTFTANLTGIDDDADRLVPNDYIIYQSYPNPFNNIAIIKYGLPKSGYVSIILYDILGRQVAELVDGNKQAGYHQVVWNARNNSSGMYFYRIQAGEFAQTKKMLLLK
ncbi:MAG: T9SS type A sorting domain-containing protein [candidate division Zixibacteria bacterium]|nr:T9SS type A sorting domain-containing protein [candidate division Zixibacteria bacterium]